MLNFGIDVVVMSSIALVCLLFTYVICKAMAMVREDGMAALTASFATGVVMVVGYVIMAAILDAMLGVTW